MQVTVNNDLEAIDYDDYADLPPVPVNLPHLYTAREYQKPLWQAALGSEIVYRYLLLWHRRAGKDKTFWNVFIAKTQERPGLYLYMLPTTSQAKKVIWKGQDKEGIKFLDHIPKELIQGKPHQADMSIDLKNGSVIMVLGSDNYDRIVGTNPIGVVFSEYSIADPLAWDYIRPILAENGGWAMFCYTPRGKNHGYKLYENNKNNPKWYVSKLDVTQTFDAEGNRAISEEAIQDEIDSGMDEATVDQEFYLSFNAIGQGVIYKSEIQRMQKENRVCRIPIDTRLPVHTSWDLGYSDDMALWFFQILGKEIRLINFYRSCLQGMQHYIEYMLKFQEEHGFKYGDHYGPHDLAVHDLMSGESRIKTAKAMGIRFKPPVERPKVKADGINAVRQLFPRFWIDSERCEDGLSGLESYSREYDEKLKVYRDIPKHDWASNVADSLQTLALAWKDKLPSKNKPPPRKKPVSGGWMK